MVIRRVTLALLSFLSCQVESAAFDYNNSPTNKVHGITITPTTPSSVLNSYLQTTNLAGLPNNTFGSFGTVTTNISAQTSVPLTTGYSMLLQSNGKVVVGGNNGGAVNAFLIRYNTDGTLDSSFGTGGISSIGYKIGPGIALLSNGQILVADGLIISVYDTNGTFNSNIVGPGGMITAIYNTLLIQQNGDIVGAGLNGNGPTNGYQVTRFLPNHSVDTAGFANPNGYIVTLATGNPRTQISSLTINPGSGTIYAAGLNGDDNTYGVTSYSSDGVTVTYFTHQQFTFHPASALLLDSNGNLVVVGGDNLSFISYANANSGAAPTSAAHVTGKANSVLLEPGINNIVVVGNEAGTNLLKIARFIGTAGGTYGNLDTTFGTNGIVSGIPITTFAAIVQTDGKIVVSGICNNTLCVIRLNTDGSIDPTFFTSNFFGASATAYAAVEQSNGNFIAAGTDGSQFCLVPYNSQGTINTSFGNGLVKGPNGIACAAMYQPDETLVAVGNYYGTFCVARYTTAGILDSTFGSGTGFVTGPAGTFNAYAVLLQSNGDIVALGSTALTGGNFCLARYTSTGTVDTTFGGGLVTGHAGTAYAGLLQSNGQIVAAGNDGAGNIYVVRYNSNGSADTTFNNTGTISGTAGTIYAALAQSNGQLIFFGSNGAGHFLMLRSSANGIIDTTFGTNGLVTGPAGTAYAALLQSDGKILALGNNGGGNLCLARFNTNGSLDTTFGSAGTGIIVGGTGTIYTTLLQSNDNILGIGNSGAANFLITNYINPLTPASFTASYGQVGML